MGTICTIHCNPYLSHQRRWAAAFEAGFRRHGLGCEISDDPEKPADLHVVLGPHYALKQWRNHPRCVWLDRAFWGDPDYASIGWAAGEGRAFPVPAGIRAHPELKPWRIGREAIVLADYLDSGERLAAMVRPHVASVSIRRHPVEGGSGTLQSALESAQIAIGRSTSALVEAAFLGLSIVCLDRHNAASAVASNCIRDIRRPDRREWAQQLAWGNWCHAEIESGELWACLTTVCDC